jgi:hypothetical protein
VCDALVAHGATFNGSAWGAPSGSFSWVSELPLTGVGPLPPAAIVDKLRSDSGQMLYRVGMELADLGPVAVTFDGLSTGAAPPSEHPVLLLLEAHVYAIPRIHWSPADRKSAEKRQHAVLECLEALCQALDPAYAVLGIERLAPVPVELAARATLAADAYISDRLATADSQLRDRLDEIAQLGTRNRWRSGGFYSGWFVAEASDQDQLRGAWAAASSLVGDALGALPG